MPILKLDKNEAVKLYGPLSITVKTGCIDIQGKLACSEEKITVHKTRNYIAIATEPCELDISMINDSQIQILEKEDPYWVKRQVVEDIVKRGFKKIIAIGSTDSGKSSLITLLFNTLLSNKHRVVVIDSDVGQADIGPPGFISMGTSSKPVYWINEIKPLIMRFIGDIKPQLYTRSIISEIRELIDIAEKQGFTHIVIDTDGWVKEDYGIIYKHNILESIKPDAIIVLGEELKGYFTHFTKLNATIYEINAPVHRKIRTREERRLIRSFKYREFLENASIVKVGMEEIVVSGCPLFHGVNVDSSSIVNFIDGKVYYATRLHNTLHLYGFIKGYNSDELKKLGFEKVKVYPVGFEKRIYCALETLEGFNYPCIIEKFDFNTREVVLRTMYTGKISMVKLSRMKLTEDYAEEYLEV